ncbi:DUF1542 domain-containing protein, partial [Streptococcus suis]|nr:DUF1542 domain-containing protein [Streptococcus suis]
VTLAGEKAVAKEELKAAAEDAKKAIDANDNLTDAEKQAAKDAVDAEVAKANEAIDAATSLNFVSFSCCVDGFVSFRYFCIYCIFSYLFLSICQVVVGIDCCFR